MNVIKRFPMNEKGLDDLAKMILRMSGCVEQLKISLIEKSLDYLDIHARQHLKNSIGKTAYIPTGELLSHFQKDYNLNRFFNDCFYSVFVEFGTGIVGEGTHPNANGYNYDVNSHGEDGWYYKDANGVFHWTKGMEAHRYMHNALNDYLVSGMNECFEKALKEVMVVAINES